MTVATRPLFTGAFPAIAAPPLALTEAPAGGWVWFGDPRAVYYGGVLYWGYLRGSDGSVMLASYDGETVAHTVLHSEMEVDDHNPPSLLVKDSQFWAFYSKHNDTVTRYRVADLADLVFDTEVELDTGTSMSYAYVYDDGGDIRLIVRDSVGDTSTWKMLTYDGSWSAPVSIYADAGRFAYLRMVQDGARIHVAVSDGHPFWQSDVSIYHFYIEGGVPYATDGTELSFPVSRSTATLVYSGASVRSWVWDVSTDASGSPVIAFATFPSTSDHRYRYATWGGDSWSSEEVAAGGGHIYGNGDEPYYSGGIAIDRANPARVWCSRQDGSDWEMWRYIKNGSWVGTQMTDGGKNIRPLAVKDGTTIRVLWQEGTYTTYTDYSTGTWGGR